MKSFFAHFQDLSNKHGLNISREKELFSSRIGKRVHIFVDKELVDSVQRLCPWFDIVESENELSPGVSIYVASFNQMRHFKQLVEISETDEENIFLLVIETDQKNARFLSIPDTVRFSSTTAEKLNDDLNDLLERWVCDIALQIVKSLQDFQRKRCINEKGVNNNDTGM